MNHEKAEIASVEESTAREEEASVSAFATNKVEVHASKQSIAIINCDATKVSSLPMDDASD